MSKRILGIDIRNGELNAALVSVTMKGVRVEAHYRTPVEQGGGADLVGLSQAFAKLAQAEDFTLCECVAAIPADEFYYRNIRLPFRDKKKIDQVLPFEIEPTLPTPVDNLVFDFQIPPQPGPGSGDATFPVMVVALDKTRMEAYLNALKAGRFNPSAFVVGGLPTALCLARHEGLTGDWGFVDMEPGRVSIFFFNGDRLLLTRSLVSRLNGDDPSRSKRLATVCRDIRLTLLAADDTLVHGFTLRELWAAGSAFRSDTDPIEMSQHIGVPVHPTRLTGHAAITMDATVRDGWHAPVMDHALALALAETQGIRSFNFRKGPRVIGKFWSENRRSLISAGTIGILALLLLLINTFMDIHGLGNKERELTRRINAIFLDAFPNEPIVSPVEQMRKKIKDARAETALSGQGMRRVGQLEILHDISRLIPKDRDMEITRLVVTPDSVMITGNTDTYDGVNEIAGGLEKSDFFKQVAIGAATSDARTGRIRFQLNVEL